MDAVTAFNNLIESFGDSQQMRAALETELNQSELTLKNKGMLSQSRRYTEDKINLQLISDEAYQGLLMENERQSQISFELKLERASLEENIKSLNAELTQENKARAKLQLSLANFEKEAQNTQTRIRKQKDNYCTLVDQFYHEYLRKRETYKEYAAARVENKKGEDLEEEVAL